MRDKQITELRDKGYSKDQILETLYNGINKNMRKYALKNIESHLNRKSEKNS